jgi:RNA polymerase sigma factor (TIGR02999 family)
MDPQADITQLLRRAEAGDRQAHEQVLPLIYDELKKIAHGVRGPASGAALNTTALVHEAYLRLIGVDDLDWPDRHRFYSYAAHVMRGILVDEARRSLAIKRAGDQQRIDFELAVEAAIDFPADLLEIDAALATVEKVDPKVFGVIELHVFAGLEFAEVARCLGIGERSVYRLWSKGKALLHGLLQDERGLPPPGAGP